jgi:hypothetical protein
MSAAQPLTRQQKHALRWLFARNRTGVLCPKGDGIVAGGDQASFGNALWRRLEQVAMVAVEGTRVRLTPLAIAWCEGNQAQPQLNHPDHIHAPMPERRTRLPYKDD